ncbi:LysR family transcriptional regulator [Pendulispora albinea]|uniref:LysR family transcriptional regulator n=1 Tax=Pendulispora albinea TaxID=2741071 RepID=A0ABZ2LYL4_9BACT
MIELGRLRALSAVATYGTVFAAADVLHCTPSAVSQHIAKLEQETGTSLFEKDGRRLRLTEAGRLLSEHALLVLGAVERAEAALAAHHGTVCGRVAIASFPTACRALVPLALKRLAKEHPQLDMAMLEANPHQALDLLARGEADIALVDEWPGISLEFPPGVTRTALGEDYADLVVPSKHPLSARKRPVRWSELTDERWIASTPGTICYDWVTRALPGVRPAFLVDEFETQLNLVATGLAVAMVPRLARISVPSGVTILPLDPMPSRRISVVWREASGRRPALEVTATALRQAWEKRVTASG